MGEAAPWPQFKASGTHWPQSVGKSGLQAMKGKSC